MILNQWTKITHWCPAQLFYYFKEVIERVAKVKSSLRIQGCFMMLADGFHEWLR